MANGVGQSTSLVSGHLFPRRGFDWHDWWVGIEIPDIPLTWNNGLLTRTCTGEERTDFSWLWACVRVVSDA